MLLESLLRSYIGWIAWNLPGVCLFSVVGCLLFCCLLVFVVVTWWEVCTLMAFGAFKCLYVARVPHGC